MQQIVTLHSGSATQPSTNINGSGANVQIFVVEEDGTVKTVFTGKNFSLERWQGREGGQGEEVLARHGIKLWD